VTWGARTESGAPSVAAGAPLPPMGKSLGKLSTDGLWCLTSLSTNKIDHHDITEILLKVALNHTLTFFFVFLIKRSSFM
jgi:hypothetical protein